MYSISFSRTVSFYMRAIYCKLMQEAEEAAKADDVEKALDSDDDEEPEYPGAVVHHYI